MVFGVLLLILSFVIGSKVAYAQGCPTGIDPNPGPAAIGVCLTEGGNQLTSPSGFTVTITQTLGGQTHSYGTTFANGVFITTSDIPPVGGALAVCSPPASIPYQLEITATNSSGGSFKTTYNACNANPGFLYYVTLPVSSTGGQTFGAVKGCITYTAQDGTTQPFNDNNTGGLGANPAQAIITGPKGSITAGFDTNGCLTGTQINNLVPGNYTMIATYIPGQGPHGFTPLVTYTKSFTITAGKTTDVSGKAVLSTSIKPPPTNNTTTPDISLVCSVSIFNPVTWLICPLVSAAQGAIKGLTTGIDSLLTVNTQEIFGTPSTKGTTSAGFYTAWNTFRIFGAGVIVIAGLVMLIAQAMGSDIIDAYTIHKVLPRILIAIVGITLSWWLLQFAVTLSNDVGTGIRQVIYTPFEGIGTTVKVNGGAATVGAIVGIATFLTLGLLGIASFMLTALLAVFIGFLVLFIRQVIVMMLVIFAPFAIACYVLPGTQKAWGFWKDTFISMLIVFPIISAMIAMGRVFAVVMYNDPAKDVPGFVSEIGAFIVYFAPYFMIPLAFRWAGGAMATVGGLAGNASGGISAKIKGFRQNQAAQRYERAQQGNLYRGNNRVAKAVNTLAWGGTNASKAGYNPSKWRSKMHEAHESQSYDEAMEMLEKNSALKAIANDNNALKATRMLAQGKSNAYVRNWLTSNGVTGHELDATMTRAVMVQKSGANKAVQIATFMADATSGTGWDADKVTMPDGSKQIVVGSAFNKYAADLAEVSGGDQNLAMRMYGDSKGAMARSRPEMAGQDFMVGWNEIDKQMKGGQANGATVSLDAFMHMDAGSISRAKDDAQLDLMAAARQALTNQVDQTNQVNPQLTAKVADIASGLAAAQNGGRFASPQAVKILSDTLRDAPKEVKDSVNEAMKNLGR